MLTGKCKYSTVIQNYKYVPHTYTSNILFCHSRRDTSFPYSNIPYSYNLFGTSVYRDKEWNYQRTSNGVHKLVVKAKQLGGHSGCLPRSGCHHDGSELCDKVVSCMVPLQCLVHCITLITRPAPNMHNGT